ncbi:hypothetical protein [Paraflavitalea sp. CAU 1676]|uniref:hypothetical protein n=1 Tax=Paraflavitalea sp. CAU 1676 TaxID=3032598 RepID=UPI0023D99FA2|nr:hypothetical protein [Paraflavitalea sp. CAU 1676]MDF2192873.1 hypothetical protein [Paraflavitalea sp. CAU 1676]
METQPQIQPITTPPPPVQALSWREKFSGIIVLFVGFIYLAWQISNITSSKADAYRMDNGAFQISRSELINDVRSVVSIVLALLGGWLLLRGKRSGWVISIPLLLLLNTIAGALMVQYYPLADSLQKAVGGVFVLSLLLALLFLVIPSARKKYKVTRVTFVSTLTLLALLVGLYFFL